MLIIGNLDADGYLKEPPLDDSPRRRGVDAGARRGGAASDPGVRPVGVGARILAECLLIQARHIGADDDVVVKIITEHLGNLEKKNYQAIART